MTRLLCLLGFISLFVGCPAKGGNGNNGGSESAATSQTMAADSSGKR